LGVGYDAIDDALAGRLALATLAALAIGKLVVWWLALASGTSGGTLAPILLISASTGGLVGQLAHDALPGAGISPGAFALVAVAATFGAATRAPFASIVFVFELTRDYDAVLPLMLATVLADLVARSLLRDSLMTERLTRRGLRVPEGYYPDVLTTTAVATVLTREVASLPASAPVALAIERFRTGAGPGSHSAYPVVDDDGRCVGIVTRSDLLVGEADQATRLGEAYARDLVTVAPGDTAADALAAMLDEQVDHLPIVDGDRQVGICTRTDVLRACGHQRRAEQLQPGWLRRLAG
jgi:CBS domain-containing protein